MSIKEIVFISGKGGTGKTTLTSSFIPKFKNIIIADCDVDAPDLDILLKPEILRQEDFIATAKAKIDLSKCSNCGVCVNYCKFNAIIPGVVSPVIRESHCEGCNVCSIVCKSDAIKLNPYKTGVIFESRTIYGEMIHGRLTPGEEVSGRLVSEVRKRAKIKAQEKNKDMVIIDGPPGIACNVISAITGVTLSIIVTEPTTSGLHDLVRVYETATKLKVKCAVIINKHGLSEQISLKIEEYCRQNNLEILGYIPLDREILRSVNRLDIPILDNDGMVEKILKNIEEGNF